MLEAWAAKWGIFPDALNDLRAMLLQEDNTQPVVAGVLEAGVQAQVRLDASRRGWRLWRNNVGVLPDARGVPVRYGLANDSKAVNTNIKSGDLIGIRPVLIGPQHLGHCIGQFVSAEIKRPGWTYNPKDERQAAQMAWAQLICSMGGYAVITTGAIE